MLRRQGKSVVWALVVILSLAVLLLVGKPWDWFKKAEIEKLHSEAIRLHGEEKWCEASRAWDALLAKLPLQDESREYENWWSEAKSMRQIAQSNCNSSKPSKPEISELKVPELPPDQRPAKVPEDEVVRFYPEGKTIRSIAFLNMTGSGTNKDWVFKGSTHFAYQYRVIVETKVLENRGTAVVFEQYFKDVAQLRATSSHELELDLPVNPVLQTVWTAIEENLLQEIPVYRILKKAHDIGQIIDPNLKRTLTGFDDFLRRNAQPIMDDGDLEIVQRMDKLSGQRVEIEYVSGLGVVAIKVLGGKKFDPDELERLAYHSSLFMDYFVSEGEKRPLDQPFDVRAEDVGSLCSFAYDMNSSGTLTLKKTGDVDLDGEKLSSVKVEGGKVAVQGRVDGVNRSGTITPKPGGELRYSPDKMLVRWALIEWNADTKWVSTDHLLFGTEKVGQINMKTYYEADIVKAGGK